GHLISWYKPGKRAMQRPEESDRVQIFDPWAGPEEEVKEEVAPRPPRSRKKPPFKKKFKSTKRQSYDPWAPPDEEPAAARHGPAVEDEAEDPYGPARGAYALASEDSPAPPPPRLDLPDPNLEGYGVAPPNAPTLPPIAPFSSPDVAKQEMEFAIKRRPPLPPDRPLTAGVFQFPFYPHCLS